MFLSIRNTGKISSAEIEISGITVMAGVNNTGKSTIGKVLFCLFNSFYRIEQQIRQERITKIGWIITSAYQAAANRIPREVDLYTFAATYIFEHKASYRNSAYLIVDLKNLYIEGDKSAEKYLSNDFLSEVSEKIMQILDVSDEEIFVTVLQRRLQGEFNMQINSIYRPGLQSEIALKIKNKEVNISIIDNEYITIENNFSLETEVIYLDDPLVLDDTRSFELGSHRDHLKANLSKRDKAPSVKDAIEQAVASKKLETVLAQMNKVCKGKLVRKPNSTRYAVEYREGDLETALDIKNLSTGMKAFAILKTLLLNGSLEENGIIILDEPEIHLHPEWQLRFAETIVLLQKEYSLHILLNTHSPYFLEAIEVYSHKYGVSNKCKYYLAEDNGTIASITDVTNKIEKIYEQLAGPLQDLEDMRYPDDTH